MKSVCLLIAAIIALLVSCDWRSWKEMYTDDYAIYKDSLIYENREIFIYRKGGDIVVRYSPGEYHPYNISQKLKGIILNEPSKVVFDSAKFDTNKVIDYFTNTFNRRIK